MARFLSFFFSIEVGRNPKVRWDYLGAILEMVLDNHK